MTERLDPTGANPPTPMDLVRYCPECGTIGPIRAGARDCCPDGNHAREVPRVIAEQARRGFDARDETPVAPALPACKGCDGAGEKLESGTLFVCGDCWGNGVQMDNNEPYAGQPGWKLHRCADGQQCRAAIPGGCAAGWCAHFGLKHEALHSNIAGACLDGKEPAMAAERDAGPANGDEHG